MNDSRGFTMIEALVVVAIIGVLALMAVPGLQERIVRDQVTQAYPPLLTAVRPPLEAAWAATQTFPADNAAAGLPVAEKIVNNQISSVTIANGVINMTFGNNASGALKGKILSIRPAVVDDAPVVPVTWICGNAAWPPQMAVKGENKTNIPSVFLPVDCRAP